VLLFSPTCSFICVKQPWCRGLSRKITYTCITSAVFPFRYIENVFSLYKSEFGDYYYKTWKRLEGLFYTLIHTRKLSLKASWEWNLSTRIICSNISVQPTYGVYISQLIRYLTACISYLHLHDNEEAIEQCAPSGKVDVLYWSSS
jgi:hypothetical protein